MHFQIHSSVQGQWPICRGNYISIAPIICPYAGAITPIICAPVQGFWALNKVNLL